MEEVREDEDELHAWCLLEESENEQLQEVTSEKSKLKKKGFAHGSLLSVENNSCAFPRKVFAVFDKCLNIRAHNGHRSCRACRAGERCSREWIWSARAQQRSSQQQKEK